jgi:excinuclease ABC subunit C
MSVEDIKPFLSQIPTQSGVYQFFDKDKQILYVGKAKNLAKRVNNYTNFSGLSLRIKRMVTLAKSIEINITNTELEALLLEHNLIKKLLPPFNILLKDGKTFPQIVISKHVFPQINKYRGKKTTENQKIFGPFADAFAVKKTIDLIRKTFLLRGCSDAEFNNRKKPCLDYQIKKCSAPCVNLIEQADYNKNVASAIEVLAGKTAQVKSDLEQKMQQYSQNLQYEKAIETRDQIKAIEVISQKQSINTFFTGDFDLLNLMVLQSKICIYISFYRAGQNYGAKPYFFEYEEDFDLSIFLSDFIGQFYLDQQPPTALICNIMPHQHTLLESFLTNLAHKKIVIENPQKGIKFNLLQEQYHLGWQLLEQKVSHHLSTKQILLEIKKIFSLAKLPQRIEVYDNSHTNFTNAVGAMIAVGVDGFIKSGYRKFYLQQNTTQELTNLTNNHKDDTAMLKEMLYRRFAHKNNKTQAIIPDLLLIDGGKPQVQAVKIILQELELDIAIIGIAKGENRNAGQETFHLPNQTELKLENNSPVLYFLQKIRDEAHRFAISGHRLLRQKKFIKP